MIMRAVLAVGVGGMAIVPTVRGPATWAKLETCLVGAQTGGTGGTFLVRAKQAYGVLSFGQ